MENTKNGNQEKETYNFYHWYDSKEDIKKCLECTKKECNNCLYHKNRV